TVAFMLQGRDLCEQWGTAGARRTLTKDQFRELAWRTIAWCITGAIADHGGTRKAVSEKTATTLYLQNKSMRIISSDLNGFQIMIDHYLGDVCAFRFANDAVDNGTENLASASVPLGLWNCRSWQTDVVQELWGGRPLMTHCEGISLTGAWLIKVQSA